MKYRSEVLLYSTIFYFHKIWEIWGKGFYLRVSSMKYVCIHLYIITGAWLLVYVSWFSLSVYSSVNYYLTHIRFPTVWYTGPVVYVLIGQNIPFEMLLICYQWYRHVFLADWYTTIVSVSRMVRHAFNYYIVWDVYNLFYVCVQIKPMYLLLFVLV